MRLGLYVKYQLLKISYGGDIQSHERLPVWRLSAHVACVAFMGAGVGLLSVAKQLSQLMRVVVAE